LLIVGFSQCETSVLQQYFWTAPGVFLKVDENGALLRENGKQQMGHWWY